MTRQSNSRTSIAILRRVSRSNARFSTARNNRGTIFVLFAILIGSAFIVLPVVGRDFFPTVDAGQFRLHVNAPSGTRLEESEQIFSRVEDVIREVVPPSDIATVIDNIGI